MKEIALLALCACLCGCATATRFVHRQTLDPATGKVAGCETRVTAAQDTDATKAKRSVSVGADCAARMDFGSTEEHAAGTAEKLLGVVLDRLPLSAGGAQ